MKFGDPPLIGFQISKPNAIFGVEIHSARTAPESAVRNLLDIASSAHLKDACRKTPLTISENHVLRRAFQGACPRTIAENAILAGESLLVSPV